MTQREEFEAWAKSLQFEDNFDYPIDTRRADEFGPGDKLTYCERNTRKLWLAWQAAQAAKPHPEPGKLLELADRIDHEKLWARPGVDRVDKMTPEQLDRLDAGVALRRYADLLGSNDWRIYPPKPSISYRGPTLDEVVAMVKRRANRGRVA